MITVQGFVVIEAFDVVLLQEGRTTKTIRFGTAPEIRAQLVRDGYTVVTMQPRSKRGERAITQRQTILFLRLVGDMLRYQPNVTTCLRTVAMNMADKERFKHIIYDVVFKIRNEGVCLSRAMASHEKIFDPLTITLIQAAEAAGVENGFSRAFTQSSLFLKRFLDLRSEFLKKLQYPIVLVCMGFILMFVVTQFSIPMIINNVLYKSMKNAVELPSTKILMFISATALPVSALAVSLIASAIVYYKIAQEKAEVLF